ncbi:hypothetical protein FNH22_30180 [Fulvivirga sp. M361]|uniref:nSTAND1 domain-containing NTPase n=1 Tax=Fulvivirga sp. M361 TaxID=2594266 RepID=UPI00117B92FC|nr:hypothetical protein [Fulvivirga sp. M361]TRX47258.1 hypothetical protein FNH22_30180 [Fulvivirga sp. M361]
MTTTETLFNPFPGLRSFEEGEEHLFFGRETQIDELLNKLGSNHFLAVVGSSGSGKSSLVKSGLLAGLNGGYMVSFGSAWNRKIFRPGRDPIGNMAKALSKIETLEGEDEAASEYASMIEATLRRSRRGLLEVREQSNFNPSENLLLVVDQFEEIFRYQNYKKAGKDEDILFINLLLFACQQKEARIFIVLTMRSDFMGQCTRFRGLPEAINQSLFLVPRMTREQRKAAITGPIAVGGGTITPRLVTRLLNDMGDNPDQLPILQHALMRSWDYWEKSTHGDSSMDIPHYEAIGTMQEALSLHAEEAFAELPDNEHRRVTSTIFKALTERGEADQGIRRPVRVEELCQLTEAPQEVIIGIINLFRTSGRSFLMPPSDVRITANTVIDISHESLMRIWVRLTQWVREEKQASETYLRLSGAAALYQAGKVDPWRGPELELAIKWKEEAQHGRFWAQRYDPAYERAINFLALSEKQRDLKIAEKEQIQQLRLKRVRMVAIFIGSAAICAMALSFIAHNQKLRADQQRTIAEQQTEIAEKNLAEADRQREIAEAQRLIAENNEAEARKQKKQAETQQRYAVMARNEAEIQRTIATRKRKLAISAKNEAEAQRVIAQAQREQALKAKEEADSQRKDVQKLRNLAEARNRAYQAQHLLMEGKSMESATLAITSFQMNRDNNGTSHNNEVYQALNGALYALAPTHYQYKLHQHEVHQLVAHPFKQELASVDNGGKVHIIHFGNSKALQSKLVLSTSQKLRTVCYSPDGAYLITGGHNGMVNVWETASLAHNQPPIHSITLHSSINALAFVQLNQEWHPVLGTADSLFIGRIYRNVLTIMDRIPLPSLGQIVVNPQGTQLLVSSGHQLFRFCYAAEDSMIGPIASTLLLNNEITAIAVHEDYVAVGQKDGKLAIFQLQHPNQPPSYFTLHQSAISSLSFNCLPDQLQLASTSLDHSAKLLNVEGLLSQKLNENQILLKGHKGWIRTGSVSSDGNYFFTGGRDRQVKVWHTDQENMAGNLQKFTSQAPINKLLEN